MSRRLAIFCAVVIVIGLAIPAFAAVQNVKVGGDLKVLGVVRSTFLLDQATPDGNVNAIVSIARVRIDADLTDNISTTVRLLNERAWGQEAAENTTTTADGSTEIDLDLAYVTLKEFLYSPLTLVVGRQELRYGNALIIGDPDTNGQVDARSPLAQMSLTNPGLEDLSARKSFDAVKAILDYKPLTIDLVYAKIDENNIAKTDDTTLMGVNANYKVNDKLDTEAYLFSKVTDAAALSALDSNAHWPYRDDVVNTWGLRGVYTGLKDTILQLEAAYQSGIFSNENLTFPNDTERAESADEQREAYALQAAVTYNPPIEKLKKYDTSVTASYTFLSGNEDGKTDGKYTGWDAMYENQSGGTIFNSIMGFSNCKLINVSLNMKPMEDVGLGLDYYNITLVQSVGYSGPTIFNLAGVAGAPLYTVTPDEKGLGNEVDLRLTYDYTEDVQLGLNAGMFMPGAVFDKTTNRGTASQLIGSMKVLF